MISVINTLLTHERLTKSETYFLVRHECSQVRLKRPKQRALQNIEVEGSGMKVSTRLLSEIDLC